MARANPMSGPAYIVALRNALEAVRRPTDYRYDRHRAGRPRCASRRLWIEISTSIPGYCYCPRSQFLNFLALTQDKGHFDRHPGSGFL
jgi:hypothetical protein